MDYLKVEGHNNLLRDPNTNSIINNNMSDYQQYISRRNIKNEEVEKINYLEEEVSTIKNDLDEIKTMLRSFINGSQ